LTEALGVRKSDYGTRILEDLRSTKVKLLISLVIIGHRIHYPLTFDDNTSLS